MCAVSVFQISQQHKEDDDKGHVRRPKLCNFTDTIDSLSHKKHTHTAAERVGSERWENKVHSSHFLSVITINISTRMSTN